MADLIKDTADSLMRATGAPQVGKAIAAVGSAASSAGSAIGKGFKAAQDYAGSKIAKPAARTADIALPKEQKRRLSRGRR